MNGFNAQLYAEQRAELLTIHPGFAPLLPIEPVPAPPVTSLDLAGARRHLGVAANNHASLLLIVGWGDGSVLRWIAEDALLRDKQVLVLLLAGEETAFAAAFGMTPGLLPAVQRVRPQMVVLHSEDDIATLMYEHFRHHEDLPRLAGIDIVADHPLTLAGETSRREWSPALMKALSDRPQMYGNDIMDSFTGLTNAAQNAGTILAAPTLDDCWGMFGQTPVISIAGGPSLAKHIPRLQELQHRCILVACDSVLPGLVAAGIEPHFVTPLERLPATVDLVQSARGTRTVFAGSCVVPPAALVPFEGRAIGLFAGDQLYNWLLENPGHRANTGSSTGVCSFTVGASLSHGPVYLVGHDLARARDQSHWSGASYSSGLWKEQKQRVAASARVASGYEDRMIPGNDGGLVPSIVWWDRFRGEIASDAASIRAAGRKVYNVNAHDRVGAHIDHTEAAPLPDPNDLPKLAPMQLPPGKPERLANWRQRARALPEDGEGFRAHLRSLRSDLTAARALPPERWPIEALAQRLNVTSGVSEGNKWAFYYFLRSALHNTTAEMHLRRRTPSTARFRWEVLNALDGLSDALDKAVVTLQPRLQEIARDCA